MIKPYRPTKQYKTFPAAINALMSEATRNLGLGKVIVRLRTLERADTSAPAVPRELVISNITGSNLTLEMREPRREPLRTASFYERKVVEARRRRLADFDLSQREIERLHGPVGLKIGSKTPPEIAVAILAEMTAIKNGVQLAGLVEPPKQTTQGCETAVQKQ